MPNPTFCATEAFDHDGVPTALLVITADAYSINIWIHHHEIDKIPDVINASWEAGKSIQIGRSANSPAFWCSDASSASIHIGHDDETWHVGITLPRGALQQIYDELYPLKAWLANTPPMLRNKNFPA